MDRIVTLTTDFGQSDYDSGVLAGVILRLAPQARIIDLSHAVSRHNVLEGALLLDRCTPYFPEGTLHMVVIDPGVGTSRRAIAARLGRQWFVGPDNGLITMMRARAVSASLPVEIVHLNLPEYWLPEVSPIFHGRDIFAPVTGHLAAGTPLADLGDFIADPVLLEIPKPQRTPSGWRGAIMHIDTFGNLSTNLAYNLLTQAGKLKVRVAETQIDGIVQTFGEGEPGDLVALFDSSGKLSVCVVNGSAAGRLKARVGEPVEVIVE